MMVDEIPVGEEWLYEGIPRRQRKHVPKLRSIIDNKIASSAVLSVVNSTDGQLSTDHESQFVEEVKEEYIVGFGPILAFFLWTFLAELIRVLIRRLLDRYFTHPSEMPVA